MKLNRVATHRLEATFRHRETSVDLPRRRRRRLFAIRQPACSVKTDQQPVIGQLSLPSFQGQ